ncbi:hypothetical protein P7C70_g7206, partial [Phenoliferia sp. Uapishka_3]
MPNYLRSSTPSDLVVLSSDPPSPPKVAVFKQVARMSTGGKPPRRPKTPLDAGYEWAANCILRESDEHFEIYFSPAELTRREYEYWVEREDFASASEQQTSGLILVTFFPSWQQKGNASEELVRSWRVLHWEEVVLSDEDL